MKNLKKDKKGFIFTIGAALFFLILIVGISALAFFIFSGTARYIILGIGVSIGAFWVLGQAVRAQGDISRNEIVIVLILFAIGGFLIFGSSLISQSILGDRYVEIPFFASVECKQSGISNTLVGDIDKDGEWISDNFPTNTNEWSVSILTPQKFTITNRFVEYYICTSRSFSSCFVHDTRQVERTGDVVSLGEISSSNHIWAQFQKFRDPARTAEDGATYSITYKPFRLIRDDPLRGGRQEISNTCEVPLSSSEWQKRIRSFSGSSDVDTWQGTNKLQPGDFYNYITANIVAVTEGGTQDGGWCIYENNRANVFEIERIATGDGNVYNRVNFDNIISSPQCCDNVVYPDGRICENGKFRQVEGKQCTTRADCGITEFSPSGDKEVRRAICVNNQCDFETKEVECTSDDQCDTNEFCSRNTYTCETSGDKGGGGIGRDSNNQTACEEKAEAQPLLGWTWVESETTTGKGPLGIGGLIGLEETTTTAECKPTFLIYWIVGGILLFLIIIVILLLVIPRKRKIKRR